MKRAGCWLRLILLGVLAPGAMMADTLAPLLTQPGVTGRLFNLNFTPYPSAQSYTFLSATNLRYPFLPNTNFLWSAYNLKTSYVTNGLVISTNYGAQYRWQYTNAPAPLFARLLVTPMSSNALLTAIALNRLAHGPTPDELERVTAMGPQAFIDEQLSPQSLTETIDTVPAVSNIAVKFVEAATPIYTNSASTNARSAEHT